MIINGTNYASVAIVDNEDYLLAVLNDNECICANNLRIIAESADGGLIYQDAGEKRIKCVMRKDGESLKEGQTTTLGYLKMAGGDSEVKNVNQNLDNMVIPGVAGQSPLLDMISKLPPQVLEAAVKSIISNTAVNMQNKKNAEKAKEQEESESQTVEQFEVPESELRNGKE